MTMTTLKSQNNNEALSRIEKIYVLSDLHTDNIENMKWLKNRCNSEDDPDNTPGPNDALIIAGDISHEFSVLESTIDIIQKNLKCHIFFVCGNHEAWMISDEEKSSELGIYNSIDKIKFVKDFLSRKSVACENGGEERKVYVNPELVGKNNQAPVWIAPIDAWYDGTLTIPNTENLTSDFDSFPWVDFLRCEWPSDQFPPQGNENGKIPSGLVDYFLSNYNEHELVDIRSSFTSSSSSQPKGLITVSHFLPNTRTLPDWKDINSDVFLKDEWLDHGAGGISSKFAKVAGSDLIDKQIRSILPTFPSKNDSENTSSKWNAIPHLHVFGHSHRPKDIIHNNVRYIHNPLGKPSEREVLMISREVDFQLIWDTTSGEVKGQTLIRYW